uniref:F-box domain-containing protein n=1 Tax=Rhabditophanes sp. KR3021 TaxID=114890 RepID=A0AC35U8A7_9BILA
MISTNSTYITRALAIKHVFLKCVPDFEHLSKLTMLNQKTSELLNETPIVWIKSELYRDTFKLKLSLADNVFEGYLLHEPFNSEVEYINLVDQLTDSFFGKVYFMDLELWSPSKDGYCQIKESLISTLNRLLGRAYKLVHIKFTFNCTRMKYPSDRRKHAPHIINETEILYLISSLKLKAIQTINLAHTEVMVNVEILENNESYENVLFKKFTNLKTIFLNFFIFTRDSQYYNHKVDKALKTINSDVFVLRLKCNFIEDVVRSVNWSSMLKALNKTNCIEIIHKETQEKIEECCEEGKWRDCNLIFSQLDINHNDSLGIRANAFDNFKHLKQLHFMQLDNNLNNKQSFSDSDLYNLKESFSLLFNLKHLVIYIGNNFLNFDWFERLKKSTCIFPKSIEYLQIKVTNFGINGYNEQIAEAYPNLKVLDFIIKKSDDSERLKIPSVDKYFFMAFNNLEMLYLSCLQNVQFVLPQSIRKVRIDCNDNYDSFNERPLGMEYYNQTFGSISHDIRKLKTEMEAEKKGGLKMLKSFYKCCCCDFKPKRKYTYIRRCPNNCVSYIYLNNITDFKLNEEYVRQNSKTPFSHFSTN